MINVALLGTWHVHFEGYSNTIRDNKNCNIVALWDPDEVKGIIASKKYNCEYIGNLDELLSRDDIDAVSVCTSTDLHKEVIIKSAKAGKHIFTEKVLCFTESDALETAKAVKEANIKFCISFPWRSRPDFVWMKNAIDNNLIGKINYFRMRNAHNGSSSGWLPDSFYDKKNCGGGAMMDLGAHSMYTLNWIMGKPLKASSAFTHVMIDSVEDNAVTILTYENGAIGVSETGFVAENNPFELEIVGDKGTILAGGFTDKICYNIGDGWVFPNLPAAKPSPLEYWIDGIMNNSEIPYNIDDAVDLSAIMEMAYNNLI